MIAILLATRDGEDWLPALLDSIHRQTLTDWRLLVRDDGSADKTQRVLTIAASRDRRIAPLRDWEGAKGRNGGFGLLLQHAMRSPASHVALAEQDDVWLPDRLERQAAAMRQLEAAHGAATPLLVCSDACVTDADLRIAHPSLMCYLARRGDGDAQPSLRHLLAGDMAAGCSMLGNRALIELATPLPAEARGYDEWLAICAASAGQVQFLPEAAIKYRLHAGNLAVRIGSHWRAIRWWRNLRAITALGRQAQALADRLQERGVTTDATPGEELSGPALVHQYAQLFAASCPRWRRAWGVARLGVSRPGILNRIVSPLSAMWSPPTDWLPRTALASSSGPIAEAASPQSLPRRAA